MSGDESHAVAVYQEVRKGTHKCGQKGRMEVGLRFIKQNQRFLLHGFH